VRPSQIRGVVALYLLAVVSTLCAQETVVPRHRGFPQDWSQHQVWFSRDGLLQHPELLDREPRVLHQAMQRWQAPNTNVSLGAASMTTATKNATPEPKSAGGRDWSVSLGRSHVSANMYPAKYTFNIGAPPDCNRDFAVFGLTIAGTATQANLVGFNNLYSGPATGPSLCNLTAPTVIFAYNITTVAGGKIVTSPFLSPDGTKIAFVESVAGTEAIFHVLTWTAGQGAIAAPANPGAAMTSVVFSTTSSDTISSPWMDYNSDIAYIGSDNGFVYKITGVFLGTPTLVSGNGWPARAGTARLTSPVLDSQLNFLMAGSGDGNLYQINTTNPANVLSLAVGKKGRPYSAIVAAPAVDVTNGTTFVVDANDGTSAVLVQVDTASLTQIAKARIGAGGTAAAAGTAMFLYGPAADDAYFTSPASGNIRLCGTDPATTTPWQYAFAFTGSLMNTTSSFSQQLPGSTATRCTGWIEFFNPNIAGGTDFFFFGLTQDCTGAGTSGCVVERLSDTSLLTANLNGGPTGIIVDNDSNAAQASSIYMTAVKFNAGYKFTQNGLQ
jgi:hypothetical protein